MVVVGWVVVLFSVFRLVVKVWDEFFVGCVCS